jgi:O-antigen ligase
MLLLLTAWGVVGLVWSAVAVRYWPQKLPIDRIPYAAIGLLILVTGSTFGFDFFHFPGPIPITGDRLQLGLLGGVFVCEIIRRRTAIQPLLSLDMLLIALLTFIAISVATHDWTYFNNLPLSRFLFFYLMPSCLYAVVKNSQPGESELRVVCFGLCGFSCYLAAMAIAEVKGWTPVVFPAYIMDATRIEFLGRGRGPFLNPVSNGIFMTVGLATAVMMLRHVGTKTRVVLIAAIPLIAAGILATLTRSVWLGMFVGVGGIILLVANWKIRAVIIIVGTMAGMIAFSVLGESVFIFKRDKHVTVTEMSESAKLRPIFAVIAWNMLQDRPILGYGFGQYNKHKMDYAQDAHSRLPLRKAKPYVQHNILLSLATEIGLLGVGLFILLLAKGGQLCYYLYRQNDPNFSQTFALVTLALLASYFVNGMFHDVSIIPMAHMLMFYSLAIVAANYQAMLNSSRKI